MNAQPNEQAYRIDFSEEAYMLCLTFDGFWTPLTVARFRAEITDTVTRLSATYRTFHMLIDQRSFGVQSLDTVRNLTEIFIETGQMHAGRVAVVTSSALARMQVERNLGDPRAKVFCDLESAKSWLTAATPAD